MAPDGSRCGEQTLDLERHVIPENRWCWAADSLRFIQLLYPLPPQLLEIRRPRRITPIPVEHELHLKPCRICEKRPVAPVEEVNENGTLVSNENIAAVQIAVDASMPNLELHRCQCLGQAVR